MSGQITAVIDRHAFQLSFEQLSLQFTHQHTLVKSEHVPYSLSSPETAWLDGRGAAAVTR